MTTRIVPTTYATISAAVAAAVPGDTISIIPGYPGNESVVVTVDNLTFSAPASIPGIVLTPAVGIVAITLAGGSPIRIDGNAASNVFLGNAGANIIDGADGNDALNGGSGNDSLGGGVGNDTLDGGAGDDTLNGNAGIDTVSFGSATRRIKASLAIAGAQNTLAGIDTLVEIENLIGSGYDDALTGDGNDNALSGGAGNDTLQGGAGNDTLDGGAGIDTTTYASASAGVTVSLALSGAQNTVRAGTDTLAGIENLVGTSFADVLSGNAGANELKGGAGNDTLDGGAGDDTLDGGAGIDTADYSSALAGVRVDLTYIGNSGTAGFLDTVGAGRDTLLWIDNLTGSAHADILLAGETSTVLNGGAGDDVLTSVYAGVTLNGGAGNDRLMNYHAGNVNGGDGDDVIEVTGDVGGIVDGGAGIDTVASPELGTHSFKNVEVLDIHGSGGISLTVAQMDCFATITDSTAAPNERLSIQIFGPLSEVDMSNRIGGVHGVSMGLPSEGPAKVTGTAYADVITSFDFQFNYGDTLIGGGGDDILTGFDGADFLDGGAGNDILDGGAWFLERPPFAPEFFDDDVDTVTYASAAAGVTVNLALGRVFQDTKGAGIDKLGGIENLIGSAFADTLTGNGEHNVLAGGGGNDTLVSGIGDDTLDGGSGIDTAHYANAGTGVTVALAGGARDTVGAGTDTLIDIENLTGSIFDDTLTGNGLGNVLTGDAGDDRLVGSSGEDTLIGGGGNDTLVGGTGRDFLTGGAGNDIFDFNTVAEIGNTGLTRDQIIDFAQGSDSINLATIDANTTLAGNQAFTFIAAAAFSGVAGQLRAVQGGGITRAMGDVNGDGAADFQIQLNGNLALTVGDFTL